MSSTGRIAAWVWHQRTSAIDTRERLLGILTSGQAHVVFSTCHRIELYAALDEAGDAARWLRELGVSREDRDAASFLEGPEAVGHLFAVAAGLDSAVVGEPQILAQVRRTLNETRHPMLVAALGRALYVGRAVRAQSGIASTRSVGSLAVDVLLSEVARPDEATILVIGAGEMGKLALRALARRVSSVVVANRDVARATALAQAHGGRAIALDDVPAALADAAGVISAADTRGAVLTAPLLESRSRRGPLAVIDIAVPRSVDAAARERLGSSYRSVDDLPGTLGTFSEDAIASARARCDEEARRFLASRAPERTAAIRELRDAGEVVRAEKLARAMKRLRHLSERDRRIVAALSVNITSALLHRPTLALRERSAR